MLFGKNKDYKTIGLVLKSLIVIIAFLFIYYKVFKREDFSELKELFAELWQSERKFIVFLVLCLMPFNWLLESFKWKLLANKLQAFSLARSITSVLAGLTLSIFTPNRIGEMGGRIFALNEGNKIKGALLTFVGSASQLLVTIIAGAAALIFLLQPMDSYLYTLSALLLGVLVVLLLFMYHHFYLLSNLLIRIKYLQKWESFIMIFKEFKTKELGVIFTLSLLRYLLFTFQFYLLLQVFGLSLNFTEAFVGISLTFFTSSVIPSIALTELGIRGSAALLFLGQYSNNEIGIVAASFTLWLINIVIPAIIGIPFIYRLRFFPRPV